MPEFNDGASEKEAKEFLLLAGEIRLGRADLLSMVRRDSIRDLERLDRCSGPQNLDSRISY
jgi:hypothetical protein